MLPTDVQKPLIMAVRPTVCFAAAIEAVGMIYLRSNGAVDLFHRSHGHALPLNAIKNKAVSSKYARDILNLLCHPLAINLFSFFLLSLVAFRANSGYLFHGLDGRCTVSLISTESIFLPPMLGFSNDFIEGLGNIWFPINFWVIPAYFFSVSSPGVFANFPLAYAISATGLFLATYLAGCLAGVGRTVALAAAWLVCLLCFQYAGWPLVPSVLRVAPQHATVSAVATVTLVALLYIPSSRPTVACIIAALCFLSISYMILAAPGNLILAGPTFVIFGLTAMVAAKANNRLLQTVAALVGIVIACFAAGYFHYIVGLFLYTAAASFPGLGLRPEGLHEASMLFWNPIWPHFFTVERTFVLLGLVGAVWSILRGRGILRLTAAAFLSSATVYLSIGIAHAYYPFWFGPAPYYFESYLFPYHAIFSTLVVFELMFLLVRPVMRGWPLTWRVPRLSGIMIAVIPWFYLLEAQKLAGPPNLPFFTPDPQAETPITKTLKEKIGLSPGSPFRGRAASLTGRIYPLSTNVSIVNLWGISEVLAMKATGNMHNFSGLWQDTVPTLLEYNEFMSPAYFAFVRSFFSEPIDQQIRNIVATRRIEPRLLAAVGVRFVITDAPYSGAAELRTTLEVPVSQDYVKLIGVREPTPDYKLYLYELGNPNLGQYSPTRTMIARSASEMLELLGNPDLDLTQTIVTAEPLTSQRPLVSGQLRSFLVDSGGFMLRASSPGESVLLLPLEFSHCLRITQREQLPPPRLFRANLLLTGVFFDREIDARIEYRSGPFGASRCRLRDAGEASSIELQNAFKRRPDLITPRMVVH